MAKSIFELAKGCTLAKLGKDLNALRIEKLITLRDVCIEMPNAKRISGKQLSSYQEEKLKVAAAHIQNAMNELEKALKALS